MPRKITLEDVPLLADDAVPWTLREGVEPVTKEFSCTPEGAAKLLEKRGPLTLKIYRDDGTVDAFKNLYALQALPGIDPYRARVKVADVRWLFTYPVLVRRYNMRRRTGFFRIQANNVLELERTSEVFKYAAYSLNNGKAWTAQQIIADVLDYIAKYVLKVTNTALVSVFDAAFTAAVSVEMVEVDDSADSALRRVLAYVPDAKIFVDPDGKLIVTSRAVANENGVYAAIEPEVVGGGHVITVSHANECPSEIHCKYSIEAELRFDFSESDVVTAPLGDTQRVIANVLPQPDYKLTINGQNEVQGTWDDLIPYLDAIGAPPGLGVPKLSLKFLRQAFMPFMDLWSAVLNVGLLDTDADWAARVAALQTHYRRTFRLPRGWMDRILALRAYRVATVNQATGERAPASAYSDYAILGGQRSQLRDYSLCKARGGPIRLVYAINVPGYRTILDDQARPAPATVSIIDHDQGIIHLDYLLDPNRVYEQVLPSKVEENGFPGFTNPKQSRGQPVNLTFDMLFAPGAPKPELAKVHKVAVVLTATPAAPNDTRQLYTIVVKPDDVKDLLPPQVLEAAKRGKGPIKEVRVNAGLETARLRWLDSRAADFEKLFGIQDGVPNLAGLCVNAAGPAAPMGAIFTGPRPLFGANGFSAGKGASLDEISRAIAARIWASYRDHYGGQITGNMNRAALPLGWVSEIDHVVQPTGETFTKASFPTERGPELDFRTLLDSGTRAVLMRQVFSGK